MENPCVNNIVGHIDEVWNHHKPSFLPFDPYKRAQVKFWEDNYIDKHLDY
jgi:hypothetical protein